MKLLRTNRKNKIVMLTGNINRKSGCGAVMYAAKSAESMYRTIKNQFCRLQDELCNLLSV